MPDTPEHPAAAAEEASLGAILHRYAQRAPARHLGGDVALGLGVAASAAALRPRAWILLAGVGVALAMLGLWAWADRAVEQRDAITAWDDAPRITRPWRVLRGIAATIGTVAALVAAFGVIAGTLGTWIS